MAYEDPGTEEPRKSVRAVERAGRIVTVLAEHPYPLALSELAARVKLSPASVHRLLKTLMGMGWVEQNTRTSHYRLGTTMLGIGSTGLITNPLVQNGKQFLVRLADLSEQDAALSTLVGSRVVHLARVRGAKNPISEFEAGLSIPAHAIADGKLLMAHLPAVERFFLYEVEDFHGYTSRTIVEPSALEAEFADIRQRGYAFSIGERVEGAGSLAVPVLDANSQPLLAMISLGLGDWSEGYIEWLSRQMLSLAGEMSEYLTRIGDMPKPSNESARFNLE